MDKGSLAALASFVISLAENPAVRAFYVGRSARPTARRGAHQCRVLLVLAVEATTDEAMVTEAALLKALRQHRKSRNVVAHGGGGVPRQRGASVVYLALWSLGALPKKR